MPDVVPLANVARTRVRAPRLGRICLDLAVTGGDGPAAAFEVIPTPDDLSRWLSERFGVSVPATEADLAVAHSMRRALWPVARALAAGSEPAIADIEVIDEAARHPTLVPQAATATPFHQPTAAQALSDIARDAIDLLTHSAQRERIRECAADDCPLVFYDDSRPGSRRWCAGRGCAERHRARTYRARRSKRDIP